MFRLTRRTIPFALFLVAALGQAGIANHCLAAGVSPAPARLMESCHSSNPSRLCLALKYVVYKDTAGRSLATASQAITNLREINRVWNRCGIQFEISDFMIITPQTFQLKYQTSSFPELDQVRTSLGTSNELLVVTTGAWGGLLGAGRANAWTTLPGGSGPFGAVIEKNVALDPNLIAHELGHYLGLSHASDAKDLMNPVIYQRSTSISRQQCARAHNAVESYWSAMLR